MPPIPEEVKRLAELREEARRARDFDAADAIREAIRDAGYEVTDTGAGPRLDARSGPATPTLDARRVESVLKEPASFDASVHWLVEGWPEDVRRGIDAFGRLSEGRRVQHVVVDVREDRSGPPWPGEVEELTLRPGTGWAEARNAGLVRSLGSVVLVVDGSVEATGDVLAPLLDALSDPTVGITGPFGITSPDLHEFRESSGPEVDAVEGYLMAFRRELLREGLRFDGKFRYYRTADIELSFQVKARGLRATVTAVPARRHEHRMWTNTPRAERDRLSKRNYYRFLDRWRGRTDLLVYPGGPVSRGGRGSAERPLPPDRGG